jgi:hypothetical protein
MFISATPPASIQANRIKKSPRKSSNPSAIKAKPAPGGPSKVVAEINRMKEEREERRAKQAEELKRKSEMKVD